jgi:hypothetical protein
MFIARDVVTKNLSSLSERAKCYPAPKGALDEIGLLSYKYFAPNGACELRASLPTGEKRVSK